MTCILHTHAYTLTHVHHYTRYKLGWAPKSAQKPVRIRNIASTRRGGGGGGRVRISAGAAVPSISDFLWSVWSQVPLPPPIPPPTCFFFLKPENLDWSMCPLISHEFETDMSHVWMSHVTHEPGNTCTSASHVAHEWGKWCHTWTG